MNTLRYTGAETLPHMSVTVAKPETVELEQGQELSILDILSDAKDQALQFLGYALGPKSIEQYDAEMRAANGSTAQPTPDNIG